MSFETKFRQDITNFQRYGTYTYQSDEVGNVIFNSSSNDFSEVYLALPLPNFLYDNTKLVSFYDPTFTEFVPSTQIEENQLDLDFQTVQEELDIEKAKNETLTEQLNTLIEETANIPSPNPMATKQVILELRKLIGQGRVDSDFSEDFPYTPLKKETNIMSPSNTNG